MKKLSLLLISFILFFQANAYNISGMAVNSETGEQLSDFIIILGYPSGGVAASTTTASDGSFILTDIMEGTYNLKFYTYPDPIIIDGDYFLNTIYPNQITVNGANITGIEFNIPPHHPTYTLMGSLYDAVTNEMILMQDFEVRAGMQNYVEYFYAWNTQDGMYMIENLPDWTYEFNIFENDYYEGVDTIITINTSSPDTVIVDFYLQPKSGATVSGVLLDSTTNQPIMQAGRSIKLSAINSIYTQTNEQGEFTFNNVSPGIFSSIEVNIQDTSYVNCVGSEIDGFEVPEEGISDVELYQKPWISIHEVTADASSFIPGESQTITFSITNDDLAYGSIWGVNLIFPDGISVTNTSAFYSNNETIFDLIPDCGSDAKKAWEGWHWVGIPPFATSVGNLDELNETASAEVSLEIADTVSVDTKSIFYEIYYAIHCNTIQPFSFGNIIMQNEDVIGIRDLPEFENKLSSSPNPASESTTLLLTLSKQRKGEISLYNISGQEVISKAPEIFYKGESKIHLKTNQLQAGIYFYTFLSNDIRLQGKLVISQ